MARIRLEEESDEEKDRLKDEKALDELGLPSRRLRIWVPIIWRLNVDSRLRVLREKERFYVIIKLNINKDK